MHLGVLVFLHHHAIVVLQTYVFRFSRLDLLVGLVFESLNLSEQPAIFLGLLAETQVEPLYLLAQEGYP